MSIRLPPAKPSRTLSASSPQPNPRAMSGSRVARAEALYMAGRTVEAQSCACEPGPSEAEWDGVRLRLVRGVATFDLGDAVEAIRQLADASQEAHNGPLTLRFSAAMALFVRQADFRLTSSALDVICYCPITLQGLGQ